MMSEQRLKGDWGISPGDVVKMKKPHPCGGYTWYVIREGADVRIRCETCGRVVSLVRQEFIRRVRAVIQTAQEQKGEDSEQ